MNSQNDNGILQRVSGGDHSAFGELYQKYYRRVYGYCFRLVGDRSVVEDIVQTVFIKALESLQSLEKPELFYYWLFTIARNEVYAFYRSKRTNGVNVTDDEVWENETPHDRLVRKETVSLVEDGLNRLKVEYREVLILRQYEGLTYAEIAAITNCTISSVESRLFKARKALIKYLEPLVHERGKE